MRVRRQLLNKLRLPFYLISILLIISNLYPYTNIDPEFIKYHNEFINIVNTYCTEDKYFNPLQTSINFGPMDRPHIGYSQRGFSRITIVIDKEHWDIADEDMRYSLLFHEQSHSVLGLDHVEDEHNYMYFAENFLPKHVVKQQLIDLLIKRCSGSK